MNFCVNCGSSTPKQISLCQNCHMDPSIPEEIIDETTILSSPSIAGKRINVLIEYPGERASLALAIAVSVVIGLAFSVLTIGVFLIGIFLGLLYLKLRERSLRTNYVRCSQASHPLIYKLSKLAAYRLGIPLYPVYIVLNPTLNAYTTGFWGDHWIVLHSSLLKDFDEEGLLFIIGHEMGHIKREHSTWLNLSSPASNYAIPIIADLLKIIFNNWHLKAEYSADRAGLIASRDLNSCISSLLKLVGEKNIDIVEEYLRDFEHKSADPLLKIGEYFQDHPYIPNRIKKLREFSSRNLSSIGG